MSDISEEVRVGLFAKLNVAGVTSIATGGVHSDQAPATAEMPYVIFNRQAPGNVNYTFGPTLRYEDDLWLIKAITDLEKAPPLAPQKQAENILAACLTALGSTLTLASKTVIWLARLADIPPYQEVLTDRVIFHRGFLLRVAAE